MLAARTEAADPFGDAIAALRARNPDPFFVQVGGFDGESFDPLRPHVVAHDLRGLIFEPIPQYFEKLKALYAGSRRVTPVNIAVAEADGERTIWRFNPEAVERGLLPPHFAGISSFLMEDLLKETGVLGRSSPNEETTRALRQLVQAVPIRARTMSGVLDEYGVTSVDILQIDTEGYDFIILKLFDFERFRPAVVHYEHQHLQPDDRAAAEALLVSHGYRIVREDYDTLALLEGPRRTTAPGPAAFRTQGLRALAAALGAEGRAGDAITILEHLAELHPGDAEVLRQLSRLLSAQGRTLDAMARLVALKGAETDVQALIGEIQAQTGPAIERFNRHMAAGQPGEAEPYISALAALVPQHAPILAAAMNCNRLLGRTAEAAGYARALLKAAPGHPEAVAALKELEQAGGDLDAEITARTARALAADYPAHRLLQLRDIHDAASLILTRRPEREAELERLLAVGRALQVEVPPGTDWEGWEKHYRLMVRAMDLDAVRGPTPPAAPEPELVHITSVGEPLPAGGLRALADRLGAKAVFFAAADEAYVDQYARWYALSVLKHCDVPALVVIHVIGGMGRLEDIARRVGVRDERLVFAADRFQVSGVRTRCYDAPPKGMAAKPLAHLQSVRFQRLGALLQALQRPVFVSDIDLLLQRGVADLLDRWAEADVVFNENEASAHAGSRLTANLLLARPTANAHILARFLRAYLDRVLEGPEVSRWIDQLALLLARRHLQLRGEAPAIGYFDTTSDINNVMYPSYEANPFRFLSLFHGFDTSSLEGEGGAGIEPEEPRPASAPASKARKPRRTSSKTASK